MKAKKINCCILLTKLFPSSLERLMANPKLMCSSKKLSKTVLKHYHTQNNIKMDLLLRCAQLGLR